MHRSWWKRLTAALATVCAIATLVAPLPVYADEGDYDVANGHVYTQTAGSDAPAGAGFLISDGGGIPFWAEFQRLGGVDVLGYPITHRFEMGGFVVQATQRVVLQWRPEIGTFAFTNIMDDVSDAGFDDELGARLTPPWERIEEAGLTWDQVVAGRWALLDESPELRTAYFAKDDPMRWYGLPTGHVTQYPGLTAIRTQRAVLQLWTLDMPWASVGTVTVANAGDLAKSLGMFPVDATTPSAQGDAIVEQANVYRATIGLPPLIQSPELMRAAQSHADYYIANLGDSSAGGLHTEVPGKPGFTGASIGDRARAQDYPLGWVNESFGFREPRGTLDWALLTANHRYMFVHPSSVHIGYGTATSGRTTVAIFNIGMSPQHTADVALPSVYPVDGATDVPRSWDGGESPNPAPGIERPLGPPVTIIFGLGDRVEWGDIGLYDPAGNPIAIVVARSDWQRGLAIIPHDPLAGGVTFRVSAAGMRNGEPFEFSSQFTTRS